LRVLDSCAASSVFDCCAVVVSAPPRAHRAGRADLDRVELAVLGGHLAPPRLLHLLQRLGLGLEPVERLPPLLELLAQVRGRVRVPRLGVLDAPLEVGLDVRERLEPAEHEVVEHAKVRERLRLARALALRRAVSVMGRTMRLPYVPYPARGSAPCTGRS
jgi:hypothetical protein